MVNLDFLFVDNKNGCKFTKRWINKYYPSVISMIDTYSIENNLSSLSFKEQLWFYINKISIKPICYCGKSLKFVGVKNGYGIYCSNKCSANSIEKKKLLKEINIKKYGVEYFTQTDDYKIKTAQTNLEKYGVEFTSQVESIKNKITNTNVQKYGHKSVFESEIIKCKIKKTKKEKYDDEYYNNATCRVKTLKEKYTDISELEKFLNKQKETNLIKFGNEFANRTPEIKEKNKNNTINSVINKYGVTNVFSLEDVINKIKENNFKLFKERYPDLNIIRYDTLSKTNEIYCDKCGLFNIDSSLLYKRYKSKNEICTNCNKINDGISQIENELVDFIKSLNYPDIIINDRKILNGKELDIYIPSKNIAIEFDGLYWHSEIYKDKSYHLNKTLACEEKGIKLIHIFEDEWIYKQDICKSRLRNILGLTENRIFGRKCEIREVNSKDSKAFLDRNHLQGNVNAGIKLGLYYMDELVSLMSFNKIKEIYNLVRFANKLNTNVIGGADKLLKYFIKTYQPKEVISFSDRRWSTGDLYEKLGFKMNYFIPPNYTYVIGTERHHKFNFRKNKKFMKHFDLTKTEHEIMLENKIYRIYDCGLNKWILNIDINC